MSQLLVSLLLIALAAAAGWFAMLKLRSGRYERLSMLARAGDVEAFDACLASNLSRMLISPYAKGKLRMTLAEARGSEKDVRGAVNELMKLELSAPQRFSVAADAFAMLARMGDDKGCSRLLKEIEGSAAPEVSARYRCYFETAMCGLGTHEGELRQRLAKLEDTPARKTRGHVEYLLALACKSNGKTGEADALRKRAARDLNVQEDQLEGTIDVAACI